MQLKKDLAVLEAYGFHKIDKEEARECEDWVLAQYEYEYNLGHSRRGQFYSVFVDSEGVFHLYASKPDGDGGTVEIDDIFIKLIKDGIV